jgi:hypothetical protein
MTMSDIPPEQIAQELERLLHEVFLSLLGEEPANAAPSSLSPTEKLTCRVQIHGGFEGHVVIRASFAMAATIAQRMFGDDLAGPPTGQDAQEALREVSNIVAGNLKPLFGEHLSLGLPEDLDNDNGSGRRLGQAAAEHPFGRLEVRVYAAV